MTEDRDGLERQADTLLAEHAQRSPEYPCYTERWMDILARRDAPGADLAPDHGGEVEGRLAAMVVNAALTRRQRTVVRGLARGLSQREIAVKLGLSEAQVSRIKAGALQRIRSEGVLQ
ncbi:MAG TPA: hypothetical protein DEP45_10185 [Armatimonadetes bacterium]|nr:hypothetical protein [Armatimonadota bacterium]